LAFTKTKLILPFFLIPIASFLVFANWAYSIANDPSYLDGGFVIVLFLLSYSSVIACNSPTLWLLAFIPAIGLIIYGIKKRSVLSYLFLNASLLVIFGTPVTLAITGTARFCFSFIS
jgi:hypothetical protein